MHHTYGVPPQVALTYALRYNTQFMLILSDVLSHIQSASCDVNPNEN
jgi:hypothetical protein